MMRSASDRTDLTGSFDPHHAVAPIDDRTDLTGIVDSHHAVAPRSSSDRTDLTGIVDPHHAVAPRSSSDRTDLTGSVDPHHAVAPIDDRTDLTGIVDSHHAVAPRSSSDRTDLTGIVDPHHAVAPMIIPPDGGWGWIIVFTGFFTCAITDGVSFCFYLFKEPMAKDLHIQEAEVAFMSALYTGFYFIGGIVACSVGNYWGFRKVLFLGGFMSALSFGSGYVIEEMFYFLIVVGFIGGMAGGFIFVAGLLPAGFYFDKKRAIALGLVSCGSGVGAIVMPQISTVFMDIYGWRMTLVFYAGLFVVLGFMGTLIRPLKPVMVVIKPGSATSLIRKSIAPVSSLDLTLFRFPPPERTSVAPSTTANHSLIGALSAVGTVGGTPTAHPTITQMATDYDAISIRVGESCEPGTLLRLNEMMQDRTQDSAVMPSASTVFPSIYVDENMPIPIRARPWYACGCCRSYEPAVPERPLLRTDLYYTGSIIRLKEYTNMEKDVHYHLHVTKVPTYFETMQDMTRSYTYWCCRNIMTGIRSLVDYTLLMSPTFDILAACGLCMYAGYFLPFLYAKTFLEAWGKGELATTLVSITGFGTMVGRCSSGILVVAVPRFGARTTVGFANIISGVVVTAATFTENIPFVFGCMFIFGFTAGFFAPLRSIIIVDFLGLETLTSATGMMIMFQGCGSFVGAPIAELAMKYTHDGITPYRVSGALLIVAGLILWPMRRVQRWEKKRKERLSGRQTLSTSKD